MKSFVIGLSTRFFKVTIPIGRRAIGNSTGRTLICGLLTGNRRTDAGRMVRKRPEASWLINTCGVTLTTLACGNARPFARKAFTSMVPRTLSGGGSAQRALSRSVRPTRRRRASGCRAPAATTQGSSYKGSKASTLVCQRAEAPGYQNVDIPCLKVLVHRRALGRRDPKHHPRMAPCEAIDHRGDETRRQKMMAANSHIAGCGIGEELDVLHARPQFVEHHGATVEQCRPVDRRLGAVAVALEQAYADRLLEVGDRLRYDRP